MHRVGVAVVMAVAIIGLGAAGVPADTYRNGDFLQFWLQPRALLAGASPYDAAWWAAAHRDLGVRPLFDAAVYPPYDAIVFLPLAVLPLAYAAAAWVVGQVVAVLAVAVAIVRRLEQRADRMVFLAVVAAFQPFWLLAVGGNVTGWLFAALGLAYVAVLDRQAFRAGAYLGLLAVKPHPFAFLAVAVFVAAAPAERRRLVLGVLSTAGTLALLVLLLHPGWYEEWLPSALGLQSTTGSNATTWTVGRLAGSSSLLPGAALAVALAGAYAAWALRTRPSLGLALPAAIPVSLALAPHGWSYDQLHLLIPIAVLLGRISAAERPRRALTLAFALTCVAVPWILYAMAFRRAGEELSVVTPVAIFAVFVAVMPRSGHPTTPPALVASRA